MGSTDEISDPTSATQNNNPGGTDMADKLEKETGEEMVTVERYTDMLQAELAKGRLESAGIDCFLAGENAGLLYGNGLDSVQLQVASADEDDARAILNDPGPNCGMARLPTCRTSSSAAPGTCSMSTSVNSIWCSVRNRFASRQSRHQEAEYTRICMGRIIRRELRDCEWVVTRAFFLLRPGGPAKTIVAFSLRKATPSGSPRFRELGKML
jgi:hypothetical protein